MTMMGQLQSENLVRRYCSQYCMVAAIPDHFHCLEPSSKQVTATVVIQGNSDLLFRL
jgi:hypothetical protein